MAGSCEDLIGSYVKQVYMQTDPLDCRTILVKVSLKYVHYKYMSQDQTF